MLNKEDYVLTEVLGRDTPEVQALMAAAANPGMEGAVHEMLRGLARQRGWNPDDPPRFALPQGMSPSDFVIGTAMSGEVAGEEVGLSVGDLTSHLGIFGITFAGKTTLVKLLLAEFTQEDGPKLGPERRFLALDVKGEYRDLLPLYSPEKLIWLTADELNINPFELPVGEDGRPVMEPDKWINNIREWLRLFWLNEPSLNLLCEVLHDEYERSGVLVGGEDYPSLSEIIEALKQLSPPRGSDRARAKEKLLDRLVSLRAQLPGLDVVKSRDFRKLMSRSVILDLVNVKDIALPAIFGLIVMLLREVYRSDEEQDIHRMLVMDEAHLYLGGQTDKRSSDLKEGTPSSVLRDIRKVGVCGVVATHFVSDLARSVVGNLGSVVGLRQGHRQSVREAAAALNLKPWQEDEIAKLPDRRAIARFSRYGEPVYLAVKDARVIFSSGLSEPTPKEARERSRLILEAIPYVKGGDATKEQSGVAQPGKAETSPESGGGLQPRDYKVFARIGEWPELIEDRMDALGLDRESEGDSRAKLESRGLIAFAGIVGAKHRLFELTARGRELRWTTGETSAKPLGSWKLGKGSVVHEAIVYYTERSMARHSSSIRFQRAGVSPTTGGVQPDLLAILPGGGRIPIQACFKNQPAYEAGVLLRLHKLALLGPGDADKVDFVLCVAVNKRHKAAIERALQERNGGRMPDRVVLLDFDTVVDPAFDWASVFEFPL